MRGSPRSKCCDSGMFPFVPSGQWLVVVRLCDASYYIGYTNSNEQSELITFYTLSSIHAVHKSTLLDLCLLSLQHSLASCRLTPRDTIPCSRK